MSYSFTVYTDRASISKTTVYSETAIETYSYNYGTGQHRVSGMKDGEYIKFTAYPADGYEFNRWVYHIGSPDSATKYSYSNPFTYYGSTDNDIYIAAEGVATGGGSGGGDPERKWSFKKYTEQTDSFSVEIPFTDGVCYYIPITFSNDGKAIFYSDSYYSYANNPNMRGYLSRYTSFSNKLGEPDMQDTSNDDTKAWYNDTMSSTDFGFEYNVKAGTKYYLFVRNDDVNYNPGNIFIHCVAPTGGTDYFEWSSAVAQGLPIKNVSHEEWDSFIDKIIEVLTSNGILNLPIPEEKYGYEAGTTFHTMLKDCYMAYNIDYLGYPLWAKQFNVARFIIGSYVSTGIGDKISRSSKVLASDFKTLENCLKIWQDQ